MKRKQLKENTEITKTQDSPVQTKDAGEVDGRRYNAVQHGLLSKDVPLPNECEKEWEAFYENAMMDLQPVGQIEISLAEQTVVALWCLRRCVRYEARHLEGLQWNADHVSNHYFEQDGIWIDPEYLRELRVIPIERATEKIARYRSMWERTLKRFRHELRLQQEEREQRADKRKFVASIALPRGTKKLRNK